MRYDGELPELTEFPDGDGLLPGVGVSLPLVIEGYGVLVAQNGEDFRELFVQTALGPDPRAGVLSVAISAEGARSLADHLYHLAKYAELGVAAEEPSE